MQLLPLSVLHLGTQPGMTQLIEGTEDLPKSGTEEGPGP